LRRYIDHAEQNPVMTTRYRPTDFYTAASQFVDKPRNPSVSVTRGCNSQFAAISRYISETVQESAKVTTECE